MKKTLLILSILLLGSYCLFSQGVGIGTTAPDASAALDISANNRGLLIPRMNLTAINAIINPAKGLLAYDSAANQLMINVGTPVTPDWQPVARSSSGGWNLTGNGGINPVDQFVGTTDNQPLRFRINNVQAGELHPTTGNIFWGLRAGQANTTGFSNIAIGTDALKLNTSFANLIAIGDSALFHNIGESIGQGGFNIAIGHQSLFSNTTGGINIAIGFQSLFSNTIGNSNTAIGFQSLFSNITGSHNTATGFLSLKNNVIGDNNTAIGWQSLRSNTSGDGNTATGTSALFANTTGVSNTANGDGALVSNTTGNNNTATGALSLASNGTGNDNTGLGHNSLASNTSGSSNTAVGNESLVANGPGDENTAIGSLSLLSNATGNSNTALGSQALALNFSGNFNTAVGNESLFLNSIGSSNTSVGQQALASTIAADFNTAVGSNAGSQFNMGFRNTIIGAGADVTEDGIFNAVVLGEGGRATASNQVRFGNASTTSIGGIVGFTNLSDGRYKKNVKEAVKGIDFIMKLRPVTYQLDIEGLNRKLYTGKKTDEQSKKTMGENGKTVFSGFVAQEVEQAAKDAGYDFSGVDKPKNANDMYGLRYAEFVVPLVKAIQEQQQMIEELKKQNGDLEKKVLALENPKR